MDYSELDRLFTEIIHLDRGSVFMLELNKHGNLLEFCYPAKLKGNFIPVNAQTMAGRALTARRPYISNYAQGERDATLLNCLARNNGTYKIQRMITYPIWAGDDKIRVVQLVRKGDALSEAKIFQDEDLKRMGLIIDRVFNYRHAHQA